MLYVRFYVALSMMFMSEDFPSFSMMFLDVLCFLMALHVMFKPNPWRNGATGGHSERMSGDFRLNMIENEEIRAC